MQLNSPDPVLIVSIHISKHKTECLEIFSESPSKVEQSIIAFIKKHQIKHSALQHLKNIIYEQFRQLHNNTLENQRGRQNKVQNFSSFLGIQNKADKKLAQQNVLPLTLTNYCISKPHAKIAKSKETKQLIKNRFHAKCKKDTIKDKSINAKPQNSKSLDKNCLDSSKPIDLSINVQTKKKHTRNLTFENQKMYTQPIKEQPIDQNVSEQKYRYFTIEDLQSQINTQMKSILFQKFIEKRQSALHCFFKKLTKKNPPEIKFIHPQYVDFTDLSQEQLVGLQLFFEKINGENLANLTFQEFKRLVIEKQADCIIRILQLYY